MKQPSRRTDGAVRTLKAFLDANRRRDEEGMRACLTRKTLESGAFTGPNAPDATYVMEEPQVDGDRVILPLKVVPEGAPPEAAMTLPCILVEEEGAWKFDLAATMERAFGGVMETAVEQVAGAMSQAMEGVATAMQSAFGAADEAAPAQRWDDAPLEPSDEELLELPAMRPLPASAAALSAALGFDVSFAVDMENVLARAGAGRDQEQVLFDWFEQALFTGWPQILAQAAERTPLRGRLLGVRIEAAQMSRDRFVAVDGNHLVYRLNLPHNDGFYSDEELARILPGVVAGLPDVIDRRAAEHRLLPNDDERPQLSLCRERLVPRHMRRICSLLGRHVDLDLPWDELYDSAGHGLPLSRWGTNRVLGAIAYACADRRPSDLKGIRMRFVHFPHERAASFSDGVLEVAVNLHGGEAGCLYEHEIAAAL